MSSINLLYGPYLQWSYRYWAVAVLVHTEQRADVLALGRSAVTRGGARGDVIGKRFSREERSRAIDLTKWRENLLDTLTSRIQLTRYEHVSQTLPLYTTSFPVGQHTREIIEVERRVEESRSTVTNRFLFFIKASSFAQPNSSVIRIEIAQSLRSDSSALLSL